MTEDSRQSRVMVLGSLHHDIMVSAPTLPRLGETVAGSTWSSRSGGKGLNQATAAAKAGAKVSMVGAVGNDYMGRGLVEGLIDANVDCSHVRVARDIGTGISVAITEKGGDYGAVIVSGANLTLDEVDVAKVASLWSDTSVLLLQNEVPEAANILAAEAARSAGVTVVFNAAPARAIPARLSDVVDILIVNAIEAGMLLDLPEVASLEEAGRAAEKLAVRFGAVVVTAGGLGLAFAGRDSDGGQIPGIPIKVVSTHGAGDVFVGALGAELARGRDLRAALEFANRSAASHVAHERQR
jgi:ribokinase